MTEELFAYSVYGFDLSSNIALPGLRASTGGGVPLAVDGRLSREIAAPATEPHLATDMESLWRFPDGSWLLRYGSGEQAPWSIAGRVGDPRLTVRWSDPDLAEDLPQILTGPGLAMALEGRDALVLHASAVLVGGRAVLLIGMSGAGKSTTAAALVRSGCALVSDDLAVLEGAPPRVHCGPGRLRLYSDSARAAGWTGSLPQLFRHGYFESDDKRFVDLGGDGFPGPVEVAAICLLQKRSAGNAAVALERMAPRAALGELLSNIYRARFLDPAGAQAAAARCAAIAGRVPVFALHRPDKLTALADSTEAIVRTVAMLD